MTNRTELTKMKGRVADAIRAMSPDLVALSHEIHAQPEVGYTEFHTARTVAHFLRERHFTVDLGIARMPTAFRARFAGGAGPAVALMAELDALHVSDAPRVLLDSVGHACGHNIMTAASVGAAIGVASLGEELQGSVIVFGSPAEETSRRSGGKALLCSHGYLNGIAAAMQIHPAESTYVRRAQWPAWSTIEFSFAYRGMRPASWLGVDRHPFEVIVRDLPTAIEGGAGVTASSPPAGSEWTIGDPSTLTISLMIRASDLHALVAREELAVVQAQKYADDLDLTVTGALVWNRYDSMIDNLAMGEAFKANFEYLGQPIVDSAHPEVASLGDMGNVSHAVPSIHPFVSLDSTARFHTSDFALATAAPGGDQAIVSGAISMGMTCIDVIYDHDLRHRIWDEFLLQ